MAIDVFTENYLEAGARLGAIRQAKRAWGIALVRTDIANNELEFLARSFRSCVQRENVAKEDFIGSAGVLRALNRRGA